MSQAYRPHVDPTRLPPHSPRTGPGGGECPRSVLLGVWAILTLANLCFVLGFGHNVPRVDEWEFIPVLTGHEPPGPWLWAQHNEHRLPLPRLIYLALFWLTGDFRSGMIASVLLLSGLSLGLMRYVARVRGWPAWTDLFVPVGLLNGGHV